MRKRHGAEVANIIARRMVMPAHRTGGQAQYIVSPAEFRPSPADRSVAYFANLGPVTPRSNDHRRDPGPPRGHVDQNVCARRFRDLSDRHISRRFSDTPPLQWLLHQRVFEAQRLLELDGASDRADCRSDRARNRGRTFASTSSAASLVGVSPLQYRQTFHTGAA